MPTVIVGDQQRNSPMTAKAMDFGYKYPNRLKLKPGMKFHDKLVSKLWRRANDAYRSISERFDTWNDIDKTLTTYIDLSASEEALKNEDSRKPVSIVFPNSYAILETMLSYMVMAFFQDPIFRYVGSSPEDTIGAMLLEKVIQKHVDFFKVPLALHTKFRDNFAYGLGCTVPSWQIQYGKIPRVTNTGRWNWMNRFVKTGKQIEFEDGVIFEGNTLTNVDPYLLLLDPHVSIDNFQRGEFFGWFNRTNYYDLLTQEQHDEDLFNVKYLKAYNNRESSIILHDRSKRHEKTGRNSRWNKSQDMDSRSVDVQVMYVKLIPREWGLGKKETPEIWHFELAADAVIIKARPSDHAHGMFPASIIASEYDGYSNTPISRIELMDGMQTVLNFLFNSHIANVRKALNDMFIVDPFLVNINDVKDPRPGKIMRMRRNAWGRGVQNAVAQFPVSNVTQGNMVDSGAIAQYMQMLSGTDNPVMGNLRQGGPERLTAGEFQGTMTGAVSRLERIARITSYQGLQDIARQFASQTQQFMDEEVYIQTIGQWPEIMQRTYGVQQDPIKVSPYDLAIGYDLQMRDGSIPGGNFAQSWIQLYQILAGNPQLAQRFDMVKIFKHIALNMGAKNVNEFQANAMPNVSTMPDEQLQQQVQQGNLAPTEEVIQ